MLTKRIDFKDATNREVIEAHLIDSENVGLNDVQKKLLERWEYAEAKIRSNELRREDIARLIMVTYSVSRVTAYQDIVNAEAVFGASVPLNKKYRIQLRIEFIERKISELYGLVHMGPVDEAGNPIHEKEEDFDAKLLRISGNKEYLHEAKELEKVLQKYYHDYPDIALPRAPRTVIYNILMANMPTPPMSVDDAIQAASKIILIQPKLNEQQSDDKGSQPE